MHRILISPNSIQNSTITITDPAALHHLRNVLRVKPDDPLECFDGQGNRYLGRVSHATARRLTVTIEERAVESHPVRTVWLGQAFIKPERFEWALQKATELGVARILPMVTARTTMQQARAGWWEHRLARWRRIMEEAARQCGRATLSTLEVPQPFAKILEECQGRSTVLFTLEGNPEPLASRLSALQGVRDVVLLIGPEGDFTPEEVALAKAAGAQPTGLGRLTLRSETAALVALALTQHALGNL